MLLYNGGAFIDPEEVIRGETMLLFFCSSRLLSNADSESLRVLLKYGVNVNATDKYGNTAIHLFLGNISGPRSFDDAKKCLVLLLQSVMETGADLHAKNNFGIEASHIAYRHLGSDRNRFRDYCFLQKNSNFWNLQKRTQIWNEVLTESGLDIAQFRSSYRGCPCQNTHFPGLPDDCYAFETGAYLDNITLRPKDAKNFFAASNCSENSHFRRPIFEVIDSADDEYDYPDEEDGHENITTTTTQEPNDPAIPDTQSKTFWNVI